MSIVFIIWELDYDTAFRAAYLRITGETIQDGPPVDATGARAMVGSARVTGAQCLALAAEFPTLATGAEPAPMGWQPRMEADI